MKRGIFISGLVLSLLVLFLPHAVAQNRHLKIVQGITLLEVYDDNIYLTNNAEQDDWITHAKPAISFDLSFAGRGAVTMGYRGDFAYYNENAKNDWQTNTALFGLNYEAPGGLILGVNNTYTDAEDPFGSDNQYKLGVPNTERWNNNLKGKLGYKYGRSLKVLGFYDYYKQAYDLEQDRTQDYSENEFGFGVQMRLLPKTWGFVRSRYGELDYSSHPAGTGSDESNDADYYWYRMNAGLTWDSGAKMTGELNLGYQWKDYDNETDPGGDRYEKTNTWIAGTAVNFAATATTTLSLNITRTLRQSGADTNEFYEDTSIGLGLRKKLMHKLTLSLGATYGMNEYNQPVAKTKAQDNYLASTSLNYRIRDWLSADLNYTYKKKDSNYVQDEFTDNQVMISVSAVYDSSRHSK